MLKFRPTWQRTPSSAHTFRAARRSVSNSAASGRARVPKQSFASESARYRLAPSPQMLYSGTTTSPMPISGVSEPTEPMKISFLHAVSPSASATSISTGAPMPVRIYVQPPEGNSMSHTRIAEKSDSLR